MKTVQYIDEETVIYAENLNNIQSAINSLEQNSLPKAELSSAINQALAQAKASGDFNGAPGKTPVKGVDYWTTADQKNIVDNVLAALPTWKWEAI